MAKKSDSPIKPAAPAKPSAVPASQPAAPKKAKPAVKAGKAAKPAAPAYTREDVALRAYFIAEKRHTHGLPGNEHLDWLEAERQLAAENGKPKKAKKAKA